MIGADEITIDNHHGIVLNVFRGEFKYRKRNLALQRYADQGYQVDFEHSEVKKEKSKG